jgi:hypothetical protein
MSRSACLATKRTQGGTCNLAGDARNCILQLYHRGEYGVSYENPSASDSTNMLDAMILAAYSLTVSSSNLHSYSKEFERGL